MMRFSRRGVLALGVGATLAAGGVVAANGAAARNNIMRATLERYLGPITIDDQEMDAFADAYELAHPHAVPGMKLALATGLSGAVGLREPVLGLLPDRDAAEFEQFERLLLGMFYMETTFHLVAPGDAIEYVTGGCLNPFADFS